MFRLFAFGIFFLLGVLKRVGVIAHEPVLEIYRTRGVLRGKVGVVRNHYYEVVFGKFA